MKGTVDLNVDLGEGFPFDDDLMGLCSSANVCLGVHAGSEALTLATVERLEARGVPYGAHPGYPDRPSMGRAPMREDQTRAWLDAIFRQTLWFARAARPAYLKPHGAFYTDTAFPLPFGWARATAETPPHQDPGGAYLARHPGAQSLAMLVRVHRLPLLGLPGTAHAELARRGKVPFRREGFADRAYRADGTLVPRSEPGAVWEDPDRIAAQVRLLAPRVDSICLHGDGARAVEFAERVRRTLVDDGWRIGAT